MFRPATIPVWIVLVATWASPVQAQSLRILGPQGLASPDGFLVALRRSGSDGRSVPLSAPRLTATGATVRPLVSPPPLARYLLVPDPGAREVVLTASDEGLKAAAHVALGPPAAKVELTLDPPSPVKNRDRSAELTVRLLRPDGSPDLDSAPPVLQPNVGTIEDVRVAAPGIYRARYVLPTTRYPEVAIIVAFSAWPHPQSIHGAFGSVRVPLASAIELPGETERDANFSIAIAGVTYGPVRSGADGRFRIPVVVPPGYGVGLGTSVDRLGNRRRNPIDLMLPPTNQLACVMNPTRLPADGVSRARVLCATSDPYGKVVTQAKVLLTARRGSLAKPRSVEAGILEWIYTAPRTLSAEPDLVIAQMRQGKNSSRGELKLELVQGPAAELSLRAPRTDVHHGGQLPLSLTVTDALGRPRPNAVVQVAASAPGESTPPREAAPGAVETTWSPPPDGPFRKADLWARAFGPTGSAPAKLLTWAEGGALFAAVTDLAGLPVPTQTLVLDRGEVTTGDDGTARLGELADGVVRVRHKDWRGLTETVHVLDGGKVVFPAGSPPGARAAKLAVELGPPVPVNVRVAVLGREVTYWVEDPKGALLFGRKVEVFLSGGTRGPSAARDGKTTFSVLLDEPITVSIADVETGVTALAEVRP